MGNGVECILLDMMQDVFRDETKSIISIYFIRRDTDPMRSTVENSLFMCIS